MVGAIVTAKTTKTMRRPGTLDRGDIAMHCPRPFGAGEEAEGRAGWGLQETPYAAETGEGDAPPPVSPSPAW